MQLDLIGKTALVLGAGGGLGSAISSALAAEGVNVAIADLQLAALERTAAAVEAQGARAHQMVWDLADLSVIDGCITSIEDSLGPVDILVNITGGPPPTPASGQEASTWTSYFNMMVVSIISTTDRVLPGMRERGWGRIITSTSSGVLSPIPNLAVSNALRLSLVGWSKSLAREVGANGITANVVVPGRIATSRIRFLDEQKAERESRSIEDVERESTGSIPLGRYGDPAEYADVVAFLASNRASYMTGSVIRVDGGLIPGVM